MIWFLPRKEITNNLHLKNKLLKYNFIKSSEIFPGVLSENFINLEDKMFLKIKGMALNMERFFCCV